MSNCLFPYKLYELLIGIVDKSLTGININGPKVILININGPRVVLINRNGPKVVLITKERTEGRFDIYE